MPHYHPPTPFAIAESLTDRAPGPVVTAWTRGAALLPAGRRWEAVRAPARLGRAVLSHGHTLGKGVETGSWPVFCDPMHDGVFFLVPRGTAKDWAVPGTVCLCDGDVAVPAPMLEGACTDLHPAADVTPSTVTVRHWIQTPHLNINGEVVLTEPHLLAQGLETALEHAGAVR